jgi:hypothetical protein
MELVVATRAVSSSTAELITRHKESELTWKISSRVIQESYDVFREINQFWAQLSDADQQKIFNTYSKIFDVFNKFNPLDATTWELRPLIKELFELHKQEDIDYWVRLKSDLIIPGDIRRTFDPDAGMAGTIERTYLEDDYRKLLPLAVSMRIMIPIWGEFIGRYSDEVQVIFREYVAFQVMATANVMNSPAMRRLEIFIRNTILKDKFSAISVYAGLSTEDFYSWAMAKAIINRLCRAELSGVNQNATIVSGLYNYVSSLPTALENDVGTITDKFRRSLGTDGDNNLSRIEGFKIKVDVPDGDVQSTCFYLDLSMKIVYDEYPNNEFSLVNRLCPDPGFKETVQQCYKFCQPLVNEQLTKAQTDLTAWVLARYVSVQGQADLDKVDIVRAIAFATAYLWWMGHKDLAAIASGIAKITMDDADDRYLADNKQRIDRAQVEDLSSRFPFLIRKNSRSKTARSTNSSLTNIDLMVDDVSRYLWVLTLPDRWVFELTGKPNERRYSAPSDIRQKLASLVIDLDQRRSIGYTVSQTVKA